MPKLSVIVPVYKAENFLGRCVDSILGQTFSDLELILVDDGSPDRSGGICDSYAARDSRVRCIHKENGGVSSARNAGLDMAAGEYITFVDSDDYIDAGMYDQMMEKAVGGADVVLCDCLKEFPEKSVVYTHPIRPGFYSREMLEKEYFPHLLMMENVEYPATISNCLLLFRRELAEGVRYLAGVRYSEDLLFGARIVHRANSFYYMKGQTFYHYVMNPASATHKFAPDKWNDYKKLHRGIMEAFGRFGEFDRQIDLCLLFFLYNAAGDILGAKELSRREREEKIRDILADTEVRQMLARLDIGKLPISAKQKAITWLYKKQWAIELLCAYFERK